MDRREFLAARKKKTTRRPAADYRTQSGINPYTGAWTPAEVTHLLKRTMFGAKKADVDYFKTLTLSQAVDELLNPAAPYPDPPLNDYSPNVPDPNVAAGATWINNPTTDGTINSNRRASFKKWWAGVMINQDRSIREKLVLFWANHFGTETNDINISHFMYGYNKLLREQCLGNFKELIRLVTIDPAMLRYLNGYLNTAAAPDENYARELQELFTVGKDPVTNNAPYTEDDVKKAAKVLTGWRINNTTFTSYFDPARHDTTSKQFSAFYGGATITGRSGATAGDAELADLLTLIFSKAEVAKTIVRKLYRWFVYYTIDTATESNVIEPLAQVFINSNYELKPVLSVLLKSEHFFDVLNQGCQIKSPVDQVIGCLREFNVVFPDVTTNYADTYRMWNYIRSWLTAMGQDIGDPPNVSGWPAYYQTPQFYELWINADTLPKRNQFTDVLITNGYTNSGKKIIIDAVGFAASLPNPGDPNALIEDSVALLYRPALTAASKQQLKESILLSGQTQDYYWTNAWNAYIAAPTNQTNYTIVNTRLKSFYQYLMNLAEYQLA